MKNKLVCALLWWVTIPHIIVYLFCKNRDTLTIDINRWSDCAQTPYGGGGKNILIKLMYLLINVEEFRNIFYLRVGYWKYILFYLPPLSSLYIRVKSDDFGAGTYIQHGFATVITAEHIGSNCWINQQVTIGYNDSKTKGLGKPWIGDNVRISAGAKVCGPIKIGDNSTIGVNAVAVKDVPANSVLIPSPMMLLYENGEKTYRKL